MWTFRRYRQLLEVDHTDMTNKLAMLQQIVDHLSFRLIKVEGEENTREWPLEIRTDKDGTLTATKVEVICTINDSVDGTQYMFSRCSDFSSTWYLPSQFLPILWNILTEFPSEEDRVNLGEANYIDNSNKRNSN